jgi:hypothetical protein
MDLDRAATIAARERIMSRRRLDFRDVVQLAGGAVVIALADMFTRRSSAVDDLATVTPPVAVAMRHFDAAVDEGHAKS